MAQKNRKGFGVSDLLRNATGGSDERPAAKNPPAEKPPAEEPAEKQPPKRREAVKPKREETPPAAPTEDSTPADAAADSKTPAEPSTEAGAGGGHRKTAKGYVKTDGSHRKRKSLFLEAHQISALEVLAMKHGYQNNVSAFIADELNLDAVADELGFTS